MPAPRNRLRELVMRLVADAVRDNPRSGPDGIQEVLQSAFQAGELSDVKEQSELPSARTIGRIKDEYLSLSKEEQEAYRSVRWPESFESGFLPWESAEAVLQLIKGQTVSNQEARWYWRITQANGKASAEDRLKAAMLMANWYDLSHGEDTEPARTVERFLIDGRFREEAAGAERTANEEKALKLGREASTIMPKMILRADSAKMVYFRLGEEGEKGVRIHPTKTQ